MSNDPDIKIDIDTTRIALEAVAAAIVGGIVWGALGTLLGRPAPDWVAAILLVGLTGVFHWITASD